MEPVRRLSPGIRVVNIDGRSYIPLEERTQILMNFLALRPYLRGRIEAQRTLNPPDDRRYVLPEEHIPILMNFLGLLRQTNFHLPAEAEHSLSDMPNKHFIFTSSNELYAVAVTSDLLSERRGRDGYHNCDEGSSSHSEAPQVFKVEHRKGPFNGFPLKREEPKRNKSSGMTTHEIIYDFSNGINSPPVRCLSIDIPSVVDQEYEENVRGGDLHGRKQEIPTNRINSPREPYVSIDVPSVVDQQQRKEHIGGEPADTTKKRDNSMISETTLAIAAQVAGTLVTRAFSGSAHFSWTANFAAVATVFAISFLLLGIGLRHVKPKLSGIMAKLGAVAISSAIILALGVTVVPLVAWTAGTMAFLLVAIGVALA